jgi:hypothetical protein
MRVTTKRRPYIEWPTFSAAAVLSDLPLPFFVHSGDVEIRCGFQQDQRMVKFLRAFRVSPTKAFIGEYRWRSSGEIWRYYKLGRWRFSKLPEQGPHNTRVGSVAGQFPGMLDE